MPFDDMREFVELDSFFRRLTTPDELTVPILDFCNTLSDREPFYIDCRPEPWSRLLCCDMNVEEFIKRSGRGISLYGYRIWTAGTDYIEAESHVLWHDPDKQETRDVSFCQSGETRILFVPVCSQFNGTFDTLKKGYPEKMVDVPLVTGPYYPCEQRIIWVTEPREEVTSSKASFS